MASEKTESNVQLRGGYKLKKVTRKNFLKDEFVVPIEIRDDQDIPKDDRPKVNIAYAVLQYKPIIKFLKVFKMWRYVMDEKTKSVRLFKDLRSAQAYINYQTNPEMHKEKQKVES